MSDSKAALGRSDVYPTIAPVPVYKVAFQFEKKRNGMADARLRGGGTPATLRSHEISINVLRISNSVQSYFGLSP